MSVLAVSALSGCGDSGGSQDGFDGDHGGLTPETVRDYPRAPLYWVGTRFAAWELSGISGPSRPDGRVSFIYGDCDPTDGGEPSCLPPIDLQVSAPCRQLKLLTRDPVWRRREVRGAPVGHHDNAPVLFSSGAQVKVYTAANDSNLALRVLRALRSANAVKPVIAPHDPIPGLPRAVLAGTRACD